MASPKGREGLKRGSRRPMLGLLVVLAVALVPAAIAWACNPQAYLRLDQTKVEPGSEMRVSGAFFKGGADLTLSTEPGGVVGTVKTSSNGSFTTTVRAPNSVGSYTLSAVGYEADGTVTNGLPARASFTVGAAAGAPPQSGSAPQSGTSQPEAARPGAAPPSAGRFAEPEVPRTRAFSSPERRSSGGREPARTGGGSGDRAAAVNTGAGVITRSTGPGARSTGAVFAGSVARADRAATASPGAAKQAREGKGAGSSAASAVGEDAWSGFESGDAPGLLSSGSDAAPEGGAGSQLGWGLGLLALGLLALVSGLTVAEVRRRRASTEF